MESQPGVVIRHHLVILFALLFLFFLQLVTVFIETVYAFGLLRTSLTVEVASVVLLLSPFLVSFLPRPPGRRWVLTLLILVVVSRGFSPFLAPLHKLLLSGLGAAAFLVLIPSFLSRISTAAARMTVPTLSAALALGTLGAVWLRSVNSGVDPTVDGPLRWTGWLLALLAGSLSVRLPDFVSPLDRESSRSGVPFRLLTFSLGISGVWTLLLFGLASPNVIASWTGMSFPLVIGALGLSVTVYCALWFLGKHSRPEVGKGVLLVWNALFVLSLTFTILTYQTRFPSVEAGYPFQAPDSSNRGLLAQVLMLASAPVLLIDFEYFLRAILEVEGDYRSLGWSFGLGGLVFLVLIFSHVFTTVYDYIPVVGPLFRDRFWLVHLLAGLILIFPVVFLPRGPSDGPPTSSPWIGSGRLVVLLGILSLTAVGGAVVRSGSRPDPPVGDDSTLRLLTYNVQQGYSAEGEKNLDGQLGQIRSLAPDVIGLQETDTNRISGGNTDLVRYFADRLGMYAYYGPKTVNGTFGIALLSRFPIEEPKTVYLYSAGEQTAAIEARITHNGRRYRVVNTHLGNGGPKIQLENILIRIQSPANTILMGDFNFNPQSPQYQLATRGLNDAWPLGDSSPSQRIGFDPAQRIDHVFISSDLTVMEAAYVHSPESDHPALVVEIRPAQ